MCVSSEKVLSVRSECVCVSQKRERVCQQRERECVCQQRERVCVSAARESVCVSAARESVSQQRERVCQQAPRKDFTLGGPQTVRVALAAMSWGRGDRGVCVCIICSSMRGHRESEVVIGLFVFVAYAAV